MNQKKVREIMIPVSKYATVNHNATIFEAMKKLEESKELLEKNMHPYKAVLVTDDSGHIIGKVGHLAFLKALEPKYNSYNDLEKLTNSNLSSEFIDTIMDNFKLWSDDIFDYCSQVNNVKITQIMKRNEESISVDASLTEALHKIIMWQTLSVLVYDGNSIVGILRLSDLYDEMYQFITDYCKTK